MPCLFTFTFSSLFFWEYRFFSDSWSFRFFGVPAGASSRMSVPGSVAFRILLLLPSQTLHPVLRFYAAPVGTGYFTSPFLFRYLNLSIRLEIGVCPPFIYLFLAFLSSSEDSLYVFVCFFSQVSFSPWSILRKPFSFRFSSEIAVRLALFFSVRPLSALYPYLTFFPVLYWIAAALSRYRPVIVL